MRFTTYQYDQAIKALTEAKEQLEPDGRDCAVCGDGGHQAFECGHNPLVAMEICRVLAAGAHEQHQKLHDNPAGVLCRVTLHDLLHHLAGYDMHMGCVVGPARVVVPPASAEEAQRLLKGLPPAQQLTGDEIANAVDQQHGVSGAM
jgi:hypothetical protein